MTEFIPDLWCYSTRQTKNFNMKNVYHVNCDKDLHYLTFSEHNLTKELDLLYRYIFYKLDDINKQLEDTNIVIVTCKSGKYIAPLVIACYLIKYGKMTIGDALNAMKMKKKDIFEGQIYYSQILERLSR